jgi:transcriptional regulator with XRE-family HTH domain
MKSVHMCYHRQVVGAQIRAWRQRRNLSLRKLAEAAGVSYVTISRIEQGRMSPTVAMLERLATALGITVRDFFPAGRPRRPKKGGGQR